MRWVFNEDEIELKAENRMEQGVPLKTKGIISGVESYEMRYVVLYK